MPPTTVGHLGQGDLRTGRTLWVRSVSVGAPLSVLVDGLVIITSPATSHVIELSSADGCHGAGPARRREKWRGRRKTV